MKSKEEAIKKFEKIKPLYVGPPAQKFINFYKNETTQLKKIVLNVKNKDRNLKTINMRAGLMFPENVIIDEEIKELCKIPFRRFDGKIFACEGIVENWKGCPPHSEKVKNTIKLMQKAKAFLIMQFEGLTDTIFQKYIHNFTLLTEKELKKNGYNISKSYTCGPCRICAKGCNSNDDCRVPTKRRFALEASGLWVNHLCRKAAEYQIFGGTSWEIQWVKDWNLPTQTPISYKSVTGILIVSKVLHPCSIVDGS